MRISIALIATCLAIVPCVAQTADSSKAPSAPPLCPDASTWNTPQRPFRIHGSTYYVGTQCLAAILVTSPSGHVLIDGTTAAAAPQIRSNVIALGFLPADIRLILNSHAHHDHAGGIAFMQHASGAMVAATEWSAKVLAAGASPADDPPFGVLQDFPPVASPFVIRGGDVMTLGTTSLTAHHTGGHTPGGTTWSWRSCENARCLELVYADSQTPVSATGFLFSSSSSYPDAVKDFESGQAVLARMRCDILITPHPGASQFWERIAARDAGNALALVDTTACKRFADGARAALARRLAAEKGKK